ncbi:MAG: hypothetical protein QXO67_05170 [Candidatus Bathyarchaeia archaeon]
MPEVRSPIFALNPDGTICVYDPTVYSPAVGVTVWSLTLDFSVAPLSAYFGDLLRFSGILVESDGTTTVGITCKPIDVIISNPSVTSVIAHTDYTRSEPAYAGQYTLVWSIGPEARVGVNYFYAKSSW